MDDPKKEMEMIYKKYYKNVYHFCLKLSGYDENVAEEITQNTFFKAIYYADSFQGNCRIVTWLCQIARNDYISYLRKEKHFIKEVEFEKTIENIPDEKTFILERLEEKESVAKITEILGQMKSPYADVFRMKVMEDKTYQEIAKSSGKSENWARVTYYRAKEQIIEKMKENGL